MKKVYVLLSLIAFTLVMQAQVEDPKAKALLDKVKEKYTAYNSLQIDFEYTLIDKVGDDVFKDGFEGKMWLSGKKFKLDTESYMLVSNGIDLWLYLKGRKTVQINKYSPEVLEEEFGFAPDQLFNVKKDDFYYKLNSDVSVDDVQCKQIELTPKDKDKNFFKVKMDVAAATNEVKQARVFDKGGQEYLFKMKSQTPNVSLSDGFFTFDPSKYGLKDENIEDLRQ